ncbi:hypothetical protein N9751_00885 [Alphaproteobacteria bacterium]|nr:hypothetical protein [Alphaproteobacteria bacterium]
MKDLKILKFNSNPIQIIITSEPYVIFTDFLGYQPVINVKKAIEGDVEEFLVYISAKSFSRSLKTFVDSNDYKFKGLELTIYKESDERMSKYIVEEL